MKKFFLRVALVIMAIVIFQGTVTFRAKADEIIPYADTVFKNASVSLNTSGKATFSAVTFKICKNIKIVTCYLQLKTGETYQSVKALSCPSADSNTNDYYATKDYSGDMTPGHTYRIKATFDADGHTLTKYSGPIDW